MKYKALFLSLLMILPIVAVALPANADITGPVIWVNPNLIKKKGPCLVSTEFTTEVKLWNKMDLTEVGVYAFDFTLAWPNDTRGIDPQFVTLCPPDTVWPFTSLISLVSNSFTAPWDHNFVIANELNMSGLVFYEGKYWNTWHLAITALDGSDALTDSQVVLATLTFHIDCEPLWPDEYRIPFQLWNVAMADELYKDPVTGIIETTPIEIFEVDNSTLRLYERQPDVHLAGGPFCEYKVGMPHTIEFWLSNINKAYGFGFGVIYPSFYLKADVQSVVICDLFPPPYETFYMKVTAYNATYNELNVVVVRPCEKPTVTHQPGPTATFSLISKDNNLVIGADQIALCSNQTITLDYAFMLSKCGCRSTGAPVEYYYGTVLAVGFNPLPGASLEPLTTIDAATGLPLVTSIDYFWRPRIGDLNLDGAVDIQDLQALAVVYGDATLGAMGWGHLDNLNTVVDIYDFVIVAKFFGKPYECIIDTSLAPVCWPN